MTALLIGLSGKAGVGKDTVADILCRDYGFARLAFADPLRDAAAAITGWSRERMTDRAQKEQADPFYGFSPRRFLQLLGTEVGRAIDPAIWVKTAMRKIDPNRHTVITDCRFANEADAIHGADGVVFRVARVTAAPVTEHASEQQAFDVDGTIENHGTVADLERTIGQVMAGVGIPRVVHEYKPWATEVKQLRGSELPKLALRQMAERGELPGIASEVAAWHRASHKLETQADALRAALIAWGPAK